MIFAYLGNIGATEPLPPLALGGLLVGMTAGLLCCLFARWRGWIA